MAKPVPDKTHLRHCILYEFNRESSATTAADNINVTYGQVITRQTCNTWYRRFSSGDLSLEDSMGTSATNRENV